ncbi:MAG: tyrosine-type recombinase/integrase [Nitrospiraceae bacterium]|nr:tyrosine-type recombinase/integrase [Nitrospiraceae bacterium]
MTALETIEILRDITKTGDKPFDYFSNPKAARMREGVYSKRHGTPFEKLDAGEIGEIIAYFMSIVKVPKNLKGLAPAKPCIQYLLERAFKALRDDHASSEWDAVDKIKEMFMGVFEAWYELVKTPKQGKKLIWHYPPQIEESLLLSFHVAAYQSSTLTNTIQPHLYYAFGFLFHHKLSEKISQTNRLTTQMKYERTARFSFEYASEDKKLCQTFIDRDYDETFIKDWTSNYRKKTRGVTSVSKNTVKHYSNTAKKLLSDKGIIARPYKVRREPGEYQERLYQEPPDGSDDEVKTKGKRESRTILGLDDDGPKTENSGNEPSLSHFPGFLDQSANPGGVLSKEEERKTTWRNNTVTNRNYLFFWDNKTAGLFHFAFLYEAFDTGREKKDPEIDAVILYLLILMHTGIDPRELLDLVAYGTFDTPQTIMLQKIGDRCYILNPAIVKLERLPQEASCLKTSDHVYIPLPEAIALYIPESPVDKRYIFSYRKKNKITRLSFDQIERFLGNLNSDYAVNNLVEEQYRHGLRLTMKKIANAFFTVYSCYYGLDQFIACHISGKAHQELMGAQLHYVHIPHELLEREYLRIFAFVDFGIRKILYDCSSQGLTRTVVLPPQEITTKPVKLDLPGYGSSSIPSLSYVTRRIATLKKAISNEQNIVRRHNLYTVYLYLGIQFSTTLRPHDDPQLFWRQYNSRAGIIVINDKDSGKYLEERILPLPKRIRRLLDNMYERRFTLFSYVRQNLCMSYQRGKTESIFFTIEDNGVYKDLTFDVIRRTFESLGLDYKVPTNMPRHFSSNYLYHRGISHDIADMWTGHQRSGREAFSIASSVRFQEAADLCLMTIDSLLDEIGFDEVRYMPRWLKQNPI